MRTQFISYKLPLICLVFFASSCSDFLERYPLDAPSMETFWMTPDQAEMWVNNLYTGLDGMEDAKYEPFSDNAFGRDSHGANNIAKGTFETNDLRVREGWDYRHIRLCLEYFENVDRIPNMPQELLDKLSGQVHFLLAYRYYKLITFYRDVPLVTRSLSVDESDVPVSPKAEVLAYLLNELDAAISLLPVDWPASENGRITKGAALALKARVLLYNEQWTEAAEAAKEVMDSGVYGLHSNFGELFSATFNNRTNEVILAKQYAEVVNTHNMNLWYGPRTLNGHALIQPTAQLQEAFEMIDGLSIDESPLYDEHHPFDNRDPRYYATFLYHGRELNGAVLDMTGSEYGFSFTFLYFNKYINDFANGFRPSHVNWTVFRYADVLLMYAEAKNEAFGPDNSVYDALDLLRLRAGMPKVDRIRYASKESLRDFIRNERRVELAGEGLRYFDIIRWKTAEHVLNLTVMSMDLEKWDDGPLDADGNPVLTPKVTEVRTFNPSKHYVWPIPQEAIDRSKVLKQHAEWQ